VSRKKRSGIAASVRLHGTSPWHLEFSHTLSVGGISSRPSNRTRSDQHWATQVDCRKSRLHNTTSGAAAAERNQTWR
jgi:hypothetical protein